MDVTTPLSERLNRYLDLSSVELQLTAANMANVDTPGYRTKGLDFAAEMGRALNSSGAGQAGTDAGGPRVFDVDGLLERPDGNNVSMDREGLNMAQTQLQFRTGVELLKHEYSRILDAIHEDAK
jgi:flagellar basal-body rod protein FlgB